MKPRLLLLMFAAVFTWHAYAADPPCAGDKNWEKCMLKEEMSSANTGVSNLVSPSQSSAKDFLSMLAASLLVPMSGNGSRPLAIDFNVGVDKKRAQRIKLQAVLAKPELSGDMKRRLASNAAAQTAVKDSLSELDDITVSAAFSPSTRYFGRTLGPYAAEYTAMLAAAGDLAKKTDVAKSFAVLLNRQDQLSGSVIYHARRNVAGADERSAQLTYEKSLLPNLWSVYKQCPREEEDKDFVACAEKAIHEAEVKSVADDPADTLALSVKYGASGAFGVLIPEYAINYRTSKSHTFTYSLSYGRSAFMTKNGRIDVAVNYEDTSVSETIDLGTPPATAAAADPPKAVRDRFVASATYTYKINDKMAMPLSLIYANHASYLGDVGRKLNAHFGVTFKMP